MRAVTLLVDAPGDRCANCGDALRGEFCSTCGQRARDLHQPVGVMLAQASEDIFSFDTRLFRTIVPLVARPGDITSRYLAGHRVAFVPPLRTYLVAALVFFGVFAFFAEEPRVTVVTRGSPEAAAFQELRKQGQSRGVVFELPAASGAFGPAYGAALARAQADPQAFGRAVFGNVPRMFFLLLPLFALLLELFYRTQGFYIEHLVFALHYHAFVFTWFTLILLVDEGNDWMARPLRIAIGVALAAWLVGYLPLALRRVYGGSWKKTLLKVSGLGVLYFVALILAILGATIVALAGF